jgi:hypothetical protein
MPKVKSVALEELARCHTTPLPATDATRKTTQVP